MFGHGARPVSVGLILVILVIGGTTAQETVDEARLKAAGDALLPYFAEIPRDTLRDRFTPAFLREVTLVKLENILKDLHKNHGKAIECRVVRMTGTHDGEVEFVFEKGVRLPTILHLESKPPHRIAGINFLGTQKENDTLAELTAEIQALPGDKAFTLMRLSPSRQTVWDHNGSQALAVGSCFKLVLLATLVDQIEAGKRNWQDTVTLQKELISLPSGVMQDWPVGAPVTLHTLATLMISRSDNTAADHLFHVLARTAIEDMQAKIGIGVPDKNRPFLSPGEFFRLKHVLGSDQQKQYLAADAAARRKLLDTLVKQTPLVQPRTLSVPEMIDQVEWFLSTSDLCRVLDWLRSREKTPQVKDILAVGRGLPVDRNYWTYLGYKFGAEPGVVSFALLLQNQQGSWFALSIAWNNPKEDVDYTRLFVFTQRLLRLAQRQQLR
jgi:beta-lactamase class A